MAIITEVQFAHEDGALADTLDALPDIDVSVIREAGTDPEFELDLIRFEGGSTGEIERVLEGDHTVERIRHIPRYQDQRLFGVEFAPETRLLNPEVTSRDGFVMYAHSSDPDGFRRGWYECWLLPDADALHDIWQHAREERFEFEIIELRREGRITPEYPGPDALTEQQREALLAAYELGYFAEPREASLEAVADSLGLSATAVGGRIKRGMKSLVGKTLVVGDRRR